MAGTQPSYPTAVPKCCQHDFAHRVTPDHGFICQPINGTQSNVSSTQTFNWNLTAFEAMTPDPDVFEVTEGRTPDCHLLHLQPKVYQGDLFYLLTNGSLYVPGHVGSWTGLYNQSQYCLEHLLTSDPTELPEALVCFNIHEELIEKGHHMMRSHGMDVVYALGALTSDLCLLVTVAAFVLLPDMRNLYGKSLLAHVSSLFAAYLAYFVAMMFGEVMHPVPCQVTGIALHYFFLSSFCWLTVMCWDMWWKFRKQVPAKSLRSNRQFVTYCLVGWGGPMVFVVASVLLNYLPGIPSDVIKPRYGQDSCWIVGSRKESFVYFFGPVTLLLSANLTFFVLTSRTIRKAQRDSSDLWKNPDSRRHAFARKANRKRMVLYLKLFVVMGLFWTAEVTSWALQEGLDAPAKYFYPTDILNSLQGVFIFLVSVGKRKVAARLWGKVTGSKVIGVKMKVRMMGQGVNGSSPSNSIHSRSTGTSLVSNGSLRN